MSKFLNYIKFLFLLPLFIFLISCGGSSSSSSSSGSAALLTIDTVNVGDAGNAADTQTGYGSVSYEYAIGKYEITVGQYITFLNAVATVISSSDIKDMGFWSDEMEIPGASYVSDGFIRRTGAGTTANPYVFTEIVDTNLGSNSSARGMPYMTWFSAARFANWIHNGATKGASTETGAYTLNGATSGVFYKNSDAKWWIPTENEWYKAAYYDPTISGSNKYWEYPTLSNSLPTAATPSRGVNAANYDGIMPDKQKITPVGAYPNSRSYYGTYDQAGLLWEWNDASYSDNTGTPLTRGMRGGSWSLGMINVSKFGPRDYPPDYDDDDSGFRLATRKQ